MGYLILNRALIQGFNVSLVTESSGHVVINLYIETDRGADTFRISTDTRFPDIQFIESKLNNALQAALTGGVDICINEYGERTYLFVYYPDGSQDQYTGNRLTRNI